MLGQIKNKHFIQVSFVCLLLLSAVAVVAFNAPKSHASGYEFVATDPYAASQPTDWGKIIWALKSYNNKLYVGYGDYGANTGPIKIAPYDPGAGTFSLEWTTNTQEIDNYEIINGKLFASTTDWMNSQYAEGLPWADHAPVGSTHIFGMTTLNGTDLWMAGSWVDNALLWHSTDGGATWQIALNMPPAPGSPSGDFVRFYFVGAYQGKIYVEPDHGYTYSEVWDGTSWSQGPDFAIGTSGWKASVFDGKMVFLLQEIVRQLAVFDGTTVTQSAGWDQITDYTIDGSYLYTVDSSCNIKRTTDLVNWQTIGVDCPSSTNTPYSIAVLDDYVYVGTTGSNIYRLQLPAAVPGDCDGDSHVGSSDLVTMLANWQSTTALACDLNQNGSVDIFDLSILLSNYGT